MLFFWGGGVLALVLCFPLFLLTFGILVGGNLSCKKLSCGLLRFAFGCGVCVWLCVCASVGTLPNCMFLSTCELWCMGVWDKLKYFDESQETLLQKWQINLSCSFLFFLFPLWLFENIVLLCISISNIVIDEFVTSYVLSIDPKKELWQDPYYTFLSLIWSLKLRNTYWKRN